MASIATAYTVAACRQSITASRKGAAKLVTDAPALPIPNRPSAVPWRSCGYQAVTYTTPTLNEPPASPRPSPIRSSIG